MSYNRAEIFVYEPWVERYVVFAVLAWEGKISVPSVCSRIILHFLQTIPPRNSPQGEESNMKATGIVRRVDDLGRIVIPKEIRRTLRIREGDPSQTTLTPWEKYCFSMLDLAKHQGW